MRNAASDDARTLSPRYFRDRAPRADPDAYLRQLDLPSMPIQRPRVVLVAWGDSPANAAAAMVRGRHHADDYGYGVAEQFASYAPRMRDAILYRPTASGFERREMEYGAAWWLVRHSAVKPQDLQYARAALRRMGAVEDAYTDAFVAEYGYLPDAVRLGREGPERPYPFPPRARVVDRRTGPVPVACGFSARGLSRRRLPPVETGE